MKSKRNTAPKRFKPDNIIIGQRYTHSDHPHYVYMGIGVNRDKDTDRQMVIVSAPDSQYLGLIVQWFDERVFGTRNQFTQFWNKFSEEA